MHFRRLTNEDGAFFEKSRPPEDRDMVDLRHLARRIWKQRLTIIVSTLLFSLLAIFIAARITPTYASLSKVMLDPQRSHVTGDPKVVPDLEISDQVVNSETSVLRSNILIEVVIREIGYDRLEVLDPENSPSLVDVYFKTPLKKGLIWSGLKQPPAILSPEQIERNRTERLIFAIRRNLSVSREGKSNVIQIRTETVDAELSMMLASTIASEYINAQLERRQEAARQATAWIEDRLELLASELDAAEAAGVKYRTESLILDGSSLQTILQQVADFSLKAAEAQAELALAKASLEHLEGLLAEGGIEHVGKQLDSSLLNALNAQRVDLIIDDGAWARDFDEDHPTRRKISRALSVIDAQVAQEVERILSQRRGEVQLARAREASIRNSLEEMEARVVSISTNAIGMEKLERKIEASRQAHEELLNRLIETRSQELLQKPDARVIEQAKIAGGPSAPRPKLITFLGGMIGLTIGFVLIFIREMSAVTFRTAEEIEKETGGTVLASIPQNDFGDLNKTYLRVVEKPQGMFAERMRQLCTSVLALGPKEKSQVMLIASSTPSEGKSTIALILAALIAKAGKSVIVADFDLRRSYLQEQFQWQIDRGLEHYLKRQCDLDQAVYSAPNMHFDVLAPLKPSGELVDLMTEEKLEKMVGQLREEYDFVIIDSPPLVPVSDSLILAQLVDSVLFVVRWNETPRDMVKKALAMLNIARSIPVRLVLNMVDPQADQDEYYGGYSYSDW